MSARDVLIRILTRGDSSGTDEVASGLDQLSRKADQLGKSLSLKVTAPLVAMGGLAVRSFAIQEQAERELAAAISATGGAVDQLLPKYKELASEIQQQTVIGDEQTLGLIAVAQQMGVTGEQMDRVVRGAIGLSKAFNLDLNMAIRAASAAVQGNTSLLTRYIPALQNVESDTDKLALALDKMRSGFVQAQAEVETTSGSLQQAKNAAGDLLEVIGAQLAPTVVSLASGLKAAAEAAQDLDPMLIQMGVGMAALAAAAGPVLVGVGSLVKYRAAIKAIAIAGGPATIAILGLTAAVGASISIYANAKKAADEFRTSAVASAAALVDQLKSATSQDDIAAVINEATAQMESVRQQISEILSVPDRRRTGSDRERLRILQDQKTSLEVSLRIAQNQGAEIVAQNAAKEESARLAFEEKQAAAEKAIQEKFAAEQLERQRDARETLLDNLDLEESILQAKIDGNETLLKSLQDQKREQIIINQLQKTGVSGDEAIARAERLVRLQNDAAAAEEKRRNAKKPTGENDGNDDLRNRLGLLDQVAQKEQASRQLKDGVRQESFFNLSGREQTRFFQGGQQIDESQAFEGASAGASATAPVSPAPSTAPVASAQPVDLSPITQALNAVTLDFSPVLGAITSLETRHQASISDLASQIQQLGN